MSRAKNLRDEDIARIVETLDGWTGKLSWELLIEAVEKRMLTRYTRQALHKHARIKDAFSQRKKHLSGSADSTQKRTGSPELLLALDRIERLKGENERLAAENTRLLEQFATWAYNAYTRGLDEALLSRPLPVVDRQQTPARREGLAPVQSESKG